MTAESGSDKKPAVISGKLGGWRPGSGRPKGATNKRTQAVVEKTEAMAAKLAEAIPGAFEGDAHALLMAVYKDPTIEMNLRLDAAKAALRVEKPSLAAVEMQADVKVTTEQEILADLNGRTRGLPSMIANGSDH